MTWDEQRDKLMCDLVHLVHDLDQDKIPHVSHNIDHINVHFFDEEDTDIGNIAFGAALQALYENIYIFPDCSTECDEENGESVGDLDIRDAVRLELQTH